MRVAQYQQTLSRGYNRRVQPKKFKVGNLVFRKVVGSYKDLADGKQGPNWEDPYKVTLVTRVRAYRLENMNDK